MSKKNIINIQSDSPQNETNENNYVERIVIITTYNDSEFLSNLKKCFEIVNQQAFNLKSPKEIYTRDLSEDEKQSLTIDYISGVQILDKSMRITFLEGLKGKSIEKIKEFIPKKNMNNKTNKYFSDSNVFFNERIYSLFLLNLKYIKLRNTLKEILTTYDLYSKADKQREIYDSFLKLGSILRVDTMKDIKEMDLFPKSEHLIMLERKYADMLIEEDLTGINTNKKNKKKKKKKLFELYDEKEKEKQMKKSQTEKLLNIKKNYQLNENNNNINNNFMNKVFKPKLDSHNFKYIKLLNERPPQESIKETFEKNLIYLKDMKKKEYFRFCMPVKENLKECQSQRNILFNSTVKNNYYVNLINRMGEKYKNDKNNHYTYSTEKIFLNFPIQDKIDEYKKFDRNLKKDFDRFTQPKREYIYLPKIKNEL
jgi:hypothetical protein